MYVPATGLAETQTCRQRRDRSGHRAKRQAAPPSSAAAPPSSVPVRHIAPAIYGSEGVRVCLCSEKHTRHSFCPALVYPCPRPLPTSRVSMADTLKTCALLSSTLRSEHTRHHGKRELRKRTRGTLLQGQTSALAKSLAKYACAPSAWPFGTAGLIQCTPYTVPTRDTVHPTRQFATGSTLLSRFAFAVAPPAPLLGEDSVARRALDPPPAARL